MGPSHFSGHLFFSATIFLRVVKCYGRGDPHPACASAAEGSVSFVVIQRGERIGVRVRDTAAEARKHFDGIPRFPADPAWRISGQVGLPFPSGVVRNNLIFPHLGKLNAPCYLCVSMCVCVCVFPIVSSGTHCVLWNPLCFNVQILLFICQWPNHYDDLQSNVPCCSILLLRLAVIMRFFLVCYVFF